MSKSTTTLNRPADCITWESSSPPKQLMDILNDNGIPKEFSACQVPGGNYIYTIPISLLTQREMILLIKSIQTQVEDDFLRATLVAAQNHIPKSSIN